MNYILRSDSQPDYSLCESETAKSVLQNLSLLLATRKGTVPMYREFGLEQEYIDKPIDIAETLLASELAETTEIFEPRAKIENISMEASEDGRIAVILEVSIGE